MLCRLQRVPLPSDCRIAVTVRMIEPASVVILELDPALELILMLELRLKRAKYPSCAPLLLACTLQGDENEADRACSAVHAHRLLV